MPDLADCTAHELLALFRSGRASPVEAAQAVHRRIARLDPVLNAFCLVAEEESLAVARRRVMSAASSASAATPSSVQSASYRLTRPGPETARSAEQWPKR